MRRCDGALALPGAHQAGGFQDSVGLAHRVDADAEAFRCAAHRGQEVAGREPSASDQPGELLGKLLAERRRELRIDLELVECVRTPAGRRMMGWHGDLTVSLS